MFKIISVAVVGVGLTLGTAAWAADEHHPAGAGEAPTGMMGGGAGPGGMMGGAGPGGMMPMMGEMGPGGMMSMMMMMMMMGNGAMPMMGMMTDHIEGRLAWISMEQGSADREFAKRLI